LPVNLLSSKANEFHKRLSFEVDCSKSARERGAILTRRFEERPRFGSLGAPGESGDRAKRCLSEG